ncbi:hypothetical protein [Haloferula sp. A504]|uniref:hypothetical protein n=1 Tax=Haloferula sp. A504 TaxID=3373601 RepID=UPI0031CAB764|nr:hypothetical protein [Verrucomicrobiaceae bacterium E54]
MNAKIDPVAEKLAHVDARLEALEYKLQEIGRPAANRLYERLEALKVEDRALRRNLEEAEDKPNPARLAHLDALIRHIEREELSVEHEAAFLENSAPSSVTVAAETGARVAKVLGRGIHKVLHGHHPFGHSVFVNHSHASLVEYHGLKEEAAPTVRKP